MIHKVSSSVRGTNNVEWPINMNCMNYVDRQFILCSQYLHRRSLDILDQPADINYLSAEESGVCLYHYSRVVQSSHR